MSSYFSGLFSFGNQNSMSDFFGNLSQYSSVRNGSYKKALTSYYKKTGDHSQKTETLSHIVKNNNVYSSAITSEEVNEIKTDTDALKKSSATLITTGTKSLFNKKEVTQVDESTGERTTSMQYDKSAIAQAVGSFVKDYNRTLSDATSSISVSVNRSVSYMQKQTKTYEKSLENIGITIGSDNKLYVDETKLKNADINKIKSLFNGSSSFAYQTSQKASQIQQAALNAANKNVIYDKAATYTSNNFMNSFNKYF